MPAALTPYSFKEIINHMPNGLDPVHLSPTERREEAACLLALGFLRSLARQAGNSNNISTLRQIPLGPSGHQERLAVEPKTKGETA